MRRGRLQVPEGNRRRRGARAESRSIPRSTKCWPRTGHCRSSIRPCARYCRAGSYELMFMDRVPARVALNEYVELAHAFFDGEESGFINGVLNQLARAKRPARIRSARVTAVAMDDTRVRRNVLILAISQGLYSSTTVILVRYRRPGRRHAGAVQRPGRRLPYRPSSSARCCRRSRPPISCTGSAAAPAF